MYVEQAALYLACGRGANIHRDQFVRKPARIISGYLRFYFLTALWWIMTEVRKTPNGTVPWLWKLILPYRHTAMFGQKMYGIIDHQEGGRVSISQSKQQGWMTEEFYARIFFLTMVGILIWYLGPWIFVALIWAQANPWTIVEGVFQSLMVMPGITKFA